MDSSFLSDYVGEIELAKRLGIGLRTLRQWRQEGVSPPITRLVAAQVAAFVAFEQSALAVFEIPVSITATTTPAPT